MLVILATTWKDRFVFWTAVREKGESNFIMAATLSKKQRRYGVRHSGQGGDIRGDSTAMAECRQNDQVSTETNYDWGHGWMNRALIIAAGIERRE